MNIKPIFMKGHNHIHIWPITFSKVCFLRLGGKNTLSKTESLFFYFDLPPTFFKINILVPIDVYTTLFMLFSINFSLSHSLFRSIKLESR